MSYGPRFPIPVPNRGKDTQTDGDQQHDDKVEGSTHSTHSGGQHLVRNDNTAARPLIDLYTWAD